MNFDSAASSSRLKSLGSCLHFGCAKVRVCVCVWVGSSRNSHCVNAFLNLLPLFGSIPRLFEAGGVSFYIIMYKGHVAVD